MINLIGFVWQVILDGYSVYPFFELICDESISKTVVQDIDETVESESLFV